MRSRIGVRLSISRVALLAAAGIMTLAGPIGVGFVQTTAVRVQPERTVPMLTESTTSIPVHPPQMPLRQAARSTSIRPGSRAPIGSVATMQVSDVRGRWMIENPSRGPNGLPIPDRLQLTFYPPDAASIDDVVSMQLHGVSLDFVRETRQMYLSVSISELVDMRINGRRIR